MWIGSPGISVSVCFRKSALSLVFLPEVIIVIAFRVASAVVASRAPASTSSNHYDYYTFVKLEECDYDNSIFLKLLVVVLTFIMHPVTDQSLHVFLMNNTTPPIPE